MIELANYRYIHYSFLVLLCCLSMCIVALWKLESVVQGYRLFFHWQPLLLFILFGQFLVSEVADVCFQV